MLNLGTLELPVSAVTRTFAILAKRGAGKSYTAAVMAEEFDKNSLPFVVFDPIDIWWGLRFNKDGRSKGLPVVVFGVLDNADILLTADMGAQIAQAIVKNNISCVLSTFGMPKNGQRKLIADFSEELLRINTSPRHVFIEEAHEYVPQRVQGDMGRTFNNVSNLVVMGRNRGIGVTLINQRAATINKDVLTQIDTLLAFRNIGPQDRQALREWVESHAAEGDFTEFMDSLPSLPTGEGWVWSPEFLEKFEKIKIRERETFHPDREKIGVNFVLPQLEQADVSNFIANFKRAEPKKESEFTHFQKKVIKKTEEVDEANKFKTQGFMETLQAKEEEIKQLEEDYQQQLQEKDNMIQMLSNKIAKAVDALTLGELKLKESTTPSQKPGNTGNINMWVDKLGRNSGEGRIVVFLSEKYPMKMNRSQIALAVGIKLTTFEKAYLPKLRRNNLVKVESDGFVSINPDLL
jgi:hypothetical protein